MKMWRTGVKVEFEKKAFEQIRQNASQVLNSDDARTLRNTTKGNATSGLLASQGLLTNLNDYVSEYGWDKIITGSLADTGKITMSKGMMGSGDLVRHHHRRGEVRSFAQQAIQSTKAAHIDFWFRLPCSLAVETTSPPRAATMKFTNGYWMIRDGVDALYAREAYELAADATTESLNVLAPTSVVRGRYDT